MIDYIWFNILLLVAIFVTIISAITILFILLLVGFCVHYVISIFKKAQKEDDDVNIQG